MDVFILVIVVLAALLVIASGIWVAFVLGYTTSSNRKKCAPSENTVDENSGT